MRGTEAASGGVEGVEVRGDGGSLGAEVGEGTLAIGVEDASVPRRVFAGGDALGIRGVRVTGNG